MTSVAVALPVCSGVTGSTRVLAETSAGGSKFAIGRSAGFVPETTAKPRATVPVVLHDGKAAELVSEAVHRVLHCRPRVQELVIQDNRRPLCSRREQ